MKTIIAVCAHGLGSGFMIELNIKKALLKLGIDAQVSHMDLSTISGTTADLFVMGKDIVASSGLPSDKVVGIKNIASSAEYEDKLAAFFTKK